MNENSVFKRRNSPEYSVSENLLILCAYKKKILKYFSPLSVAIRICLLCDLFFLKKINYKNKKIILENNKFLEINNFNKIYNQILFCIQNNENYSLKKIMNFINGENFKKSNFFVKKIRKQILNNLFNKKLLNYDEDKFYFKIKSDFKEEIFNKILLNLDEQKNEILLVCLKYCNLLKEILITLNPENQNLILTKLKQIKKRKKENFIDECIFYLLQE